MIQDSINRLAWRFKTNKSFMPNQKDKIALNQIISYLNAENSKADREYQNFSKIYVMCLKITLTRCKDINLGQKSLHQILSKDFDTILEDFVDRLNEIELNKYLDQLGVENKPPFCKSDIEMREDFAKILKNKEDYIKLIDGIWHKDEVENLIRLQINLALNKY